MNSIFNLRDFQLLTLKIDIFQFIELLKYVIKVSTTYVDRARVDFVCREEHRAKLLALAMGSGTEY